MTSIEDPFATAEQALRQGRAAEAANLFRAILRKAPRHDAAALKLGIALIQTGQADEAARILTTLTRRAPQAPAGWIALGTALRMTGKPDTADQAFRRALALDPDNAAALRGLALTCVDQQRLGEAETLFRRAMALGSDDAEIHFGLGLARYLKEDITGAEASWSRAMARENPSLAWNLAIAALKQEHWARGWNLAEARFGKTDRPVARHHTAIPQWEGAPLLEGKLLLWGDQGLGDQLLFARYVAAAQPLAKTTELQVSPALVRLLRANFPALRVGPLGPPEDAPDAQLALGSLPRALGLFDTARLSANAQYLRVPANVIKQWAQRLGPKARPRIGLVWAGSPLHPGDASRSAGLGVFAQLMPLAARCEFHSLQAGPRSAELAGSTFPIVDWSAQLADLLDTAGLIAHLDLVITVDTAVAHLAGSLGRPVWLLTPFNADWRWNPLRGETTLWYPTFRLFRQPNTGDWASVSTRIRDQLDSSLPPARSPAEPAAAMPPKSVAACLSRLASEPLDLGALAQLAKLARQLPDPKPVLSALHRGRSHPVAAEALATLLLRLGKKKVALDMLRSLTDHQPERIEAWLNRSDLARVLRHADEAVESAQRAIALDGNSADAWLHLANGLREQNRSKEALEAIETAGRLNPQAASIQNNLGVLLREHGRLDDAITAYERVLAADGKHQAARTNLGSALREKGELKRSLACFREALAAVPSNPETWFGLGNTLKEMGHTGEAIQAFRKALELKPDHLDVQVNLSLLLILSGQFPEGWDLYEQRFHRPKSPVRSRRFPQPRWEGNSLAGQRLLVWGEQGAGDKIMGYRLLNEVAPMADGTIVETDARLLRLMACNFPRVTWTAESSPPDPRCNSATLQAPVLTLARFLRRDLAAFGEGAPYLKAMPELAATWRDRLANIPGRKVGLVWAGSPTHQNDAKRSLRLERLKPLLDLPGNTFVSLQIGGESSQISETGLPIHDFTEHIGDYADTAGLAANLDLVVAVDTSVAHLTAAMGIPTWILIPFHPDWRWLESAPTTSPWYASARLFRQPRYGDWDSVIQQVALAMQEKYPENDRVTASHDANGQA